MDDFIEEAPFLDKLCISIQRARDVTPRKFITCRAKEWVKRHGQHTCASAGDWFLVRRRWSNRHDLRFLNGSWLFLDYIQRCRRFKCWQGLWFLHDRLGCNRLLLFLSLPIWCRSRLWRRWLSLGCFDRLGGLPVCCSCWLYLCWLSHHFACFVAQPCGQVILPGRLLCL